MVDFRYHVVSIVAVFLALGIGIIMGTTVIDNAVVHSLESSSRQLARDKDELRHRVTDLQEQVGDDEEFYNLLAPELISGKLAGQRVTIVAAPQGEKGVRDGLATTLTRAGATIAGRVRVLPRLSDPAAAPEIDDLVARVVPAGVDFAAARTPVARATTLLAAVLGTKDPTPVATPTASVVTALAALEDAGLIDLEGQPPGPASIVVVLVPAPAPDADDVARASFATSNVTMLSLVDASAGEARVTLVASPRGGAAERGALATLRADAVRAAKVSSVDLVDTQLGRITAVLALAEGLRGGNGHYGSGAGAEALAPDPA
jgi:hypothetical protein